MTKHHRHRYNRSALHISLSHILVERYRVNIIVAWNSNINRPIRRPTMEHIRLTSYRYRCHYTFKLSDSAILTNELNLFIVFLETPYQSMRYSRCHIKIFIIFIRLLSS